MSRKAERNFQRNRKESRLSRLQPILQRTPNSELDTTMTLNDEFNLMCDFLGAMDPEIEPREAVALTEEQQVVLDKIAKGESTDSERTSVLDLLVDNSTALEFLAAKLAAN